MKAKGPLAVCFGLYFSFSNSEKKWNTGFGDIGLKINLQEQIVIQLSAQYLLNPSTDAVKFWREVFQFSGNWIFILLWKPMNCTKFSGTALHPLWGKPTTLRSLFFFNNCSKKYLPGTLSWRFVYPTWISEYLAHLLLIETILCCKYWIVFKICSMDQANGI